MIKTQDIKMKKILTILVFLFGLLLLSCETEPILFDGPYHVRFTESGLSKKESYASIIDIEVHLASPALANDILIGYEISGTARKDTDYKILSDENKIVIKKGEYFGYIKISLINNANNILRSQDLVFTLRTVNDSRLQVGQEAGAIGSTFTLTIQDDCILSGMYSGVQNIFDIPVEDISISSNDCETYLLSNFNIGIYGLPEDVPLNFTDNDDNTLTVIQQGDNEIVTGKGTIDPVTGKINLEITITYKDENDVEQHAIFLIILTPQRV
jgi:hypothetical protein